MKVGRATFAFASVKMTCFLHLDGRVEQSSHAVEIRLADRIVLVIVALRAAQLQSKYGRAHGRGYFVQQIVPSLFLRVDIGHVGACEAKRSCHVDVGIVRLQFIARDLPLHELIVRHVLVQRFDDPVAILPRMRPYLVVLESIGFGKSSEIEPVLGPSFTISG